MEPTWPAKGCIHSAIFWWTHRTIYRILPTISKELGTY